MKLNTLIKQIGDAVGDLHKESLRLERVLDNYAVLIGQIDILAGDSNSKLARDIEALIDKHSMHRWQELD